MPWLSATPLGYATRILADGPLAYWRLDTTDGTAIDSSNTGYSGWHGNVTQGVPTPWADGRPAVTYDSAANAYTYIGYPWVFNPAGASFTLESWVRITQPTIGTIAGAYVEGMGYQLAMNGTRARFFAAFDAVPIFDVESTQDLTPGAWYHVVAVSEDASANQARLYVNGVLDASGPSTGTPSAGADFLPCRRLRLWNGKLPVGLARRSGVLRTGAHRCRESRRMSPRAAR